MMYKAAVPFVAGVLVIAAISGGGLLLYQRGLSAGETAERVAWEAKWEKERARLAIERTQAETKAREEEQRRQTEIEKVREDAQKAITQAQTDADAASATANRLHEQAKRFAARASRCASNPSTTDGGSAATEPAVVLADLLSRADARAGELAAAYDRARAAGIACERAYDALRSVTNPRQ